MTGRPRLARALLALALGLAAGAGLRAETAARADDPPASPGKRALRDHPPPADASPVPKRAEWNGADEVELARPLPDECRAHMVREWLRIRCDIAGSSGSVVGGSAAEVTFYLSATRYGDPALAEVLFPVRRGDRRVLQLAVPAASEYGVPRGQRTALLVSESWPADEPGPIVTTSPPRLGGPIHGMLWASGAEAKKRGVKARSDDAPTVVEVVPGSVAEAGGLLVGDTLLDRDFPTLAEFHRGYAFGQGAQMKFQVIVPGALAGPRYLPRGRYDPKDWTSPKPHP